MRDKHVVVTQQTSKAHRRELWRAAIKWPLYSVAVMPVLLAAGWRIGAGQVVRFDQLIGFLLASVLLLLWENLTNDLFDDETGIDQLIKPHSVVALVGNRRTVGCLAYVAFTAGLFLMFFLAIRSSFSVLLLVLGSCALGYLYQGPPFRLGYQGLGEPLCWLAFGPFATAASLLVLSPNINFGSTIPWMTALTLGAGPSLATTLVLFCSHFHQVAEDAAHGKRSPLVRLGTRKAASLVPWFVLLTFGLEVVPVISGQWPITALIGLIGIPPAAALINLLRYHHDQPDLLHGSKFLALRFQALNGLGLAFGLALAPFCGMNISALA